MKKSRTLPALLSLVLALAMMLSLSVTAFAASRARASGNGYSTTTMKVNNKDYTITAGAGESQMRAYTGGSCHAVVRMRFGTVSALFDTTHYGYVSQSGGALIAWNSTENPGAQSGYVVCKYGSAEVEKVRSVSGQVTFEGDKDVTLTVTLKNP